MLVNDTNGFLGTHLRELLKPLVSEINKEVVVIFIAIIQIFSLVTQLLVNANFNLFWPLHRILYLISRIEDPVVDNKHILTMIGSFLVLIIAAVAQYYVLEYYSSMSISSHNNPSGEL